MPFFGVITFDLAFWFIDQVITIASTYCQTQLWAWDSLQVKSYEGSEVGKIPYDVWLSVFTRIRLTSSNYNLVQNQEKLLYSQDQKLKTPDLQESTSDDAKAFNLNCV